MKYQSTAVSMLFGKLSGIKVINWWRDISQKITNNNHMMRNVILILQSTFIYVTQKCTEQDWKFVHSFFSRENFFSIWPNCLDSWLASLELAIWLHTENLKISWRVCVDVDKIRAGRAALAAKNYNVWNLLLYYVSRW
jgi:hypothetical protein